MGTVYKKTYTKPLPAGAEIFIRKGERFARWKPAKGKARTAPLTVGNDGTDRIVITAGTYTAKYRDGSGVVQEKATGCRDKEAAGRVLADMERRAELVKAKVITVAEDSIADHQDVPITEHFKTYLIKLEADETSPDHRANVRRCLERIANACGFGCLTDLKREALEKYLTSRTKQGISARTRNLDRTSIIAFCNWCIETDRLVSNPFTKVAKTNERLDQRRKRRSLTEDELIKLLDVARRRPLESQLTVHRGPRKGERYANLRPEVRRRLERLGTERALIYKTLVLTGLRKGELASLRVGQLILDTNTPYLILNAADEKNREGSAIPIRCDLANDLRQWLETKAATLTEDAGDMPSVPFDPTHRKASVCGKDDAGASCVLPADTPLFNVPDKLVRIMNRDLKAAGIPKRDDRGQTLDVHALRHTFGSLLSRGGVAPRTAQAAMRHSSIDLTMNVYTDPRLLDVAGALDALPLLPLDGEVETNQATLSATGTEGKGPSKIAPVLAPNLDKRGKSLPSVVKMTAEKKAAKDNLPIDVSSLPVKRKDLLSTPDNRSSKVGDTGLEPVTPSLSS